MFNAAYACFTLLLSLTSRYLTAQMDRQKFLDERRAKFRNRKLGHHAKLIRELREEGFTHADIAAFLYKEFQLSVSREAIYLHCKAAARRAAAERAASSRRELRVAEAAQSAGRTVAGAVEIPFKDIPPGVSGFGDDGIAAPTAGLPDPSGEQEGARAASRIDKRPRGPNSHFNSTQPPKRVGEDAPVQSKNASETPTFGTNTTGRNTYSDSEPAGVSSPTLPLLTQLDEGGTQPLVEPLPEIVVYDTNDPAIREAAAALRDNAKAEMRKR